MTLLNDPWRTAAQEPDRLAVDDGSQAWTFTQLTRTADDIAAHLFTEGLGDGATVSTDLAPSTEFFALAICALRYGLNLLPIPRWCDQAQRAALLHDAEVNLHIGRTIAEDPLGIGSLTISDLIGATIPTAVAPAPRAGCLSYVTSATTAEPTVARGRRPWYRYRGVATQTKYGAGPTFGPHIMANATHHLGTLGPALHALQAGSALVIQPTWSPDLFAELVNSHHADSAFVAPQQLAELVDSKVAISRQMASLQHGGTQCPADTKRQAIQRFGPVIHEFYGTSYGVITEISSQEWMQHPGSVGKPLPGIAVTFEQPDSNGTGEICVTPRTPRPTTAPTYPTGDLGYMRDGYLFIVGRLDADLGPRYTAFESSIRALAGVTDVAVFGSNGIACLVETNDDLSDLRLRQSVHDLAGHLGISLERLEVARPGSFTRTASGKLCRVSLPNTQPREGHQP